MNGVYVSSTHTNWLISQKLEQFSWVFIVHVMKIVNIVQTAHDAE